MEVFSVVFMYLQPKFILANVLNTLITERVKLLKVDWSVKGVFFFLILLVKRQNYLLTIGAQVA